MPRQHVPVEQNTFVAGLVTEASPLTFPPNASLDEENFILDKKGSRSRRLGMDLEQDFEVINTTVTVPSDGNLKVGSFKWENVGGDPAKIFIVVQIHQQIFFFDSSITPLSSGLVGTWDYGLSQTIKKFSYACVDGMLVVVTGRKDIDTFKWENNQLTILSKRLKIRDFFGVTDVATGG